MTDTDNRSCLKFTCNIYTSSKLIIDLWIMWLLEYFLPMRNDFWTFFLIFIIYQLISLKFFFMAQRKLTQIQKEEFEEMIAKVIKDSAPIFKEILEMELLPTDNRWIG